jgi:hypothetical protein
MMMMMMMMMILLMNAVHVKYLSDGVYSSLLNNGDETMTPYYTIQQVEQPIASYVHKFSCWVNSWMKGCMNLMCLVHAVIQLLTVHTYLRPYVQPVGSTMQMSRAKSFSVHPTCYIGVRLQLLRQDLDRCCRGALGIYYFFLLHNANTYLRTMNKTTRLAITHHARMCAARNTN